MFGQYFGEMVTLVSSLQTPGIFSFNRLKPLHDAFHKEFRLLVSVIILIDCAQRHYLCPQLVVDIFLVVG